MALDGVLCDVKYLTMCVLNALIKVQLRQQLGGVPLI